MSTGLRFLHQHKPPRQLFLRTSSLSTSVPKFNQPSAKPKDQQQKRRFSLLGAASLVTAALTSYTIGSIYPPHTIKLLFPRPAPPPPSTSSTEGQLLTQQIESQLQSLPTLISHRKLPDTNDWYETRPYSSLPEERKVNHFTTGALHAPGKLTVLPLVRAKFDESEALVFLHLGRGLCGHDGIVHGGLLATMLDESMGRAAIMNLPEKIGVTATLSIKYKAPTPADTFVQIKTHIKERQGRKIVIAGTVEDMEGKVLVEAEALFVQPRYAKLLNSRMIREVLGEPPSKDEPILLGEGTELAKKGRF